MAKAENSWEVDRFIWLYDIISIKLNCNNMTLLQLSEMETEKAFVITTNVCYMLKQEGDYKKNNYNIKENYVSGPSRYRHIWTWMGWAGNTVGLEEKGQWGRAHTQRHSCSEAYRAHAVERRQSASPQVLAGMRVTQKKLGLGHALILVGSAG